MKQEQYKVLPDKPIKLQHLSQWEDTGLSEDQVRDELVPESIERLRALQTKLHAEEKKGVLIILQAIDAAGKDEIIQYMFSHLLPQALKVTAVKKPTDEEVRHDVLWRVHDGLPERGQIAIMNRSYYEDLIAPIVHGEEEGVPMPESLRVGESAWEARARHFNQFEEYLVESGFVIVKLFLYVSKEEQRKRLLERLKDEERHWEFSFSDIEDRDQWHTFEDAFEQMLNATSTEYAPWFALPADNDWYSRYVAAEIVSEAIERVNPAFPPIEEKEKLANAIEKLENEAETNDSKE